MEFSVLAAFWGAAFAGRFAFLAFHLSNLNRLWSNYQRRGALFQIARALDWSTFALYLMAAVWVMWKLDPQDSLRLAKVFFAWFGCAVLERLQVHRFARTNVPGAYEEAKVTLFVHLVMALLGSLTMTAFTWGYYWWRG